MDDSKPVILALPGPTHWCDFSKGQLRICGQPLVIHETPGQGERGTAWAVWDGAVVAAKHLEAAAAELRPSLTPPTILELGAGTGLAGLAAALALQLPTTLTDLPEVLPSLQRNIDSNRPWAQQLVSVAALDWRQPPEPAALGGPHGLIVAADCCWLEHLVEPFARTLARMAEPSSRVLLAHQSRSARVDALLFNLLRQWFEVEPALLLPGESDRGRIELLWLRMKPS